MSLTSDEVTNHMIIGSDNPSHRAMFYSEDAHKARALREALVELGTPEFDVHWDDQRLEVVRRYAKDGWPKLVQERVHYVEAWNLTDTQWNAALTKAKEIEESYV